MAGGADQRAVALDALATTYGLVQLGGRWTFDAGSRELLKRNLDDLRELLTQMKCGEQGGTHDMDEVWHIMTRVTVEAMAMYLSGELDKMVLDDEKEES